jgi:hypothetical protein
MNWEGSAITKREAAKRKSHQNKSPDFHPGIFKLKK